MELVALRQSLSGLPAKMLGRKVCQVEVFLHAWQGPSQTVLDDKLWWVEPIIYYDSVVSYVLKKAYLI